MLRNELRSRIFFILLCTCPTAYPLRAMGQVAQLEAGTISGSTYHNPALGFRYEFPEGWVVNNAATQQKEVEAGHQIAWRDAASTPPGNLPSRCTKNLLFVTQYPAGMHVNGFNSSVFLTALDPKCLPGVAFPSDKKDHEVIQRLANEILSHFTMSTVIARSPARIRAFDSPGRVMLEISQSFDISVHDPQNTTTENIHTSMILMQASGYWISLRFASDTDYNLDRLRATKIFFAAQPAADAKTK